MDLVVLRYKALAAEPFFFPSTKSRQREEDTQLLSSICLEDRGQRESCYRFVFLAINTLLGVEVHCNIPVAAKEILKFKVLFSLYLLHLTPRLHVLSI